MGRKQQIRDAAPALHDAAREAFLLLKGTRPIEPDRRALVAQKLQTALQKAEDRDDWGRIKLTVTNTTANLLIAFAKKSVEESGTPIARMLVKVLQQGTRRTKKRAFVTLDAERDLVQHFISILEGEYPGPSRRPIERILKQLKDYNRSPLLLLAEAAE